VTSSQKYFFIEEQIIIVHQIHIGSNKRKQFFHKERRVVTPNS
jgi:hypothetical protein